MSDDYRHNRPARHQGPIKFPAENMNWYVSQAVSDEKRDVYGTACFENVSPEGHTEGSRNFQQNYQRSPPLSKFNVPKGIKCVPSLEPFESYMLNFAGPLNLGREK